MLKLHLCGLILVALMTLPGLAADAVKESIDRGTAWIIKQQNPDGGYGPFGEAEYLRLKNTSDVGVTAFALYALAKNPAGYKASSGPFISRALDFLLAKQQPDGGFYDPRDPTLQNYKTCVSLLALNTLDRVKYASSIQKAQNFIRQQQFTEEDGYKPNEHLGYGSIGYGSKVKGDMSNTQFGVEALAESGVSAADELWKKAVVFIARSRNAREVDPILKELKIGTSGDGAWRYAPDDTRGPIEVLDDGTRIFSSYGSMTYAALKSLLYANVTRDDPMVKDAFAWISRTFTVRENPGMATREKPVAGQQGLYYYYHTMAKALALYGEKLIKDAKGVEHDWATELGTHLASLQQADGSWKNTSERWMEEIEVLATSYAVIALVECHNFTTRTTAEKKQ